MLNNPCRYIKLRKHPELVPQAAAWFHMVWGIDEKEYLDSMNVCISRVCAIPQWYVVMDGDKIIAGLGIIENDFHARKDLTPNVCAVFVDEAYRNMGIAGEMLRLVCDDCAGMGIRTLYLLTNHDSFYERYGWVYLCNVRGDGEDTDSRMYVRKTELQDSVSTIQNTKRPFNKEC